jgi:hypothetical protein
LKDGERPPHTNGADARHIRLHYLGALCGLQLFLGLVQSRDHVHYLDVRHHLLIFTRRVEAVQPADTDAN